MAAGPGARAVLDRALCAAGLRSALAADTLVTLGFTHVGHIEGGFGAWKQAGLPVVITIAGGYAPTPERTAELHAIVFEEAHALFR